MGRASSRANCAGPSSSAIAAVADIVRGHGTVWTSEVICVGLGKQQLDVRARARRASQLGRLGIERLRHDEGARRPSTYVLGQGPATDRGPAGPAGQAMPSATTRCGLVAPSAGGSAHTVGSPPWLASKSRVSMRKSEGPSGFCCVRPHQCPTDDEPLGGAGVGDVGQPPLLHPRVGALVRVLNALVRRGRPVLDRREGWSASPRRATGNVCALVDPAGRDRGSTERSCPTPGVRRRSATPALWTGGSSRSLTDSASDGVETSMPSL